MKKVPEEMSRDLPRQYQTKLFPFNAQMLVQSESSSTHGNVQSLGRFTSDHLQPQREFKLGSTYCISCCTEADTIIQFSDCFFFLVTLL